MIDEQQIAKWRTLKPQNLPFDFFEEEEKEKKKELEKKKTEEEERNKNLKYFKEPRTDNEKLLNYQYEYKNGDKAALDRIYNLGKEICIKYVNTITHRSKSMKLRHMCEYDKESKAQDAVAYLVEQYIKRPDFVIRDYVTAYLWLRVVKELKYHTKADKLVDFVDIADFYKEFYKDKRNDTTRYLLWEEK